MEYVLAVDGGNTKTIALVAALDGSILGYGRGGCGDIYNSYGNTGAVGPERALDNISHAIITALQGARVAPGELKAAVYNMAGADWPEDFVLLHTEMAKRGFGQQIQVQNDALGILHTASPANVGVSVVCGTGAAIGARGLQGAVWHVSFWSIGGPEGGVQLSWKTLGGILRAELGVEPATAMRERVLQLYGLASIEDLLHTMTSRNSSPGWQRRLGSLVRILLDEAEAGDELALRIAREHGRELGAYACVAARKVGLVGEAFPLVLGGGVLRHPAHVLADAIAERVREESPRIQPFRAIHEPVIGTLYSALEMAGSTLTPEVLKRVQSTTPGEALFDTTDE